jgi:hypothetical protein
MGIREECKASTSEMLLDGPPGYLEHAVAQLVEALLTSRKVASSIPDGVIGIFH